MMRRILLTVTACVFALGGIGPKPCTGKAQNARSGPTPPRLRFVDGAVSFWRPGAEEWTQAQVNTAIAAGDSLYAGDGANVEIQIGPREFVRAGSNTQIDLSTLDSDYMQFQITGGHAALDLKTLPRGQSIEVDSPNAAFTIDRSGYYRVDIDENRTAFSAARGGTATVMPVAGETTDVSDNQQIIIEGTEAVQVSVNAAPAPDEWDRWNHDRSAQLGEAPRSAQYVPAEIAGADDLDRYGDWREQPRYGHIWVPRDVRSDWAPYSTGRWVYDPYYQWTWVDEAPWGWAPYHYGRWVYVDGFWGWAPGPVVVAPVYSPALVAFFGAPGIGVSVGVGLPFVSWVALGFGEPIIPWWGHRGFVGRPYWGGWGGPRVVNNVVINNTTIVNVTNVNRFQNVEIRNAVIGADRNQFGRGRAEHVRLDAALVQRLKPMRGDLKVQPVAASLVPREAHGQRPPDRLQRRQVVTTRAPQDPMSRLRAKGIEAKAPVMRPEPRVVRAQRGSGVSGARPQAGVGATAPEATGPQGGKRERMERAGPSGQQPPPVSGAQRPSRVETGRSERSSGPPARAERPKPAAPVTSERAMPPRPPREKRERVERTSPSGQAPPRDKRERVERTSPSGQAPPRDKRERVERTSPSGQAPPRGKRERLERTSPPGQAPAPPAVRERSRPAPAREVPPSSRAERPAPPEAPPQQPAAPQQPSHPQAPPRERAAPQQPSRGRPAQGDPKKAHEAPGQER
ncbi:MAG: hypothetical protein HY699_23510 [Deltaproteobacteria bacterium]|nr:hypothetical protein [Deltaproteobacteria bacterium]